MLKSSRFSRENNKKKTRLERDGMDQVQEKGRGKRKSVWGMLVFLYFQISIIQLAVSNTAIGPIRTEGNIPITYSPPFAPAVSSLPSSPSLSCVRATIRGNMKGILGTCGRREGGREREKRERGRRRVSVSMCMISMLEMWRGMKVRMFVLPHAP